MLTRGSEFASAEGTEHAAGERDLSAAASLYFLVYGVVYLLTARTYYKIVER